MERGELKTLKKLSENSSKIFEKLKSSRDKGNLQEIEKYKNQLIEIQTEIEGHIE